MPSKMENKAVNYSTMTTSDIVNTVRAETKAGNTVTGINFADRLPECTQESLLHIGEIFMNDPDLANGFLKEIFNRIGLVDMNYRRYENNLKDLKLGRLEYGESVEEIAFGLVKAKCDQRPEPGVTDVFEITLPQVASAIHKINYQNKYPTSITRPMLRQAFTSERSLGSFIDGIMTMMYNSYEVDEQLAYKQLMETAALNGFMKFETMAPITDEASGKAFIKAVKSLTTKMRFMSDKYSKYGLPQFTPERDMVIIIDADLDAEITVDVWAAAFNMTEVDFLRSGKKIVIDEFPAEGLRAVLADNRFFQIYDNDFAMESIYNPSNRVWNYFLHVWEIISVSPFMQAVGFVEEGSGSITAVEVTPDAVSVDKGGQQVFKANVTGQGFFNGKVAWSVAGVGEGSQTSINPAGLLTIDPNETASTLTVTATSIEAPSTSGTATVTVTSP